MANCLNRHDQKVRLIFQNCAPRGTKVSYSNSFKMKGGVYWDGFIPNSNHQFFQDQNQTFEKHFRFLCTDFMTMKFIPFFLEVSAKYIMTKASKTKSIYFMQMSTSKQCLDFSKSAFTNANIHKQKGEKTAPSWSFILMLLMTINKFSEFGRIRVDQGLDLVIESHAILCGMPSNSSVVLTSGINIVSFRI